MSEYLDYVALWWDTFYNDWLSFVPDNCKPAVLVLAVVILLLPDVVIYYKRRLARVFKINVQLNHKIDELQRDVYKANDRAANKPDPSVAEMRQMFTCLLQSMEKSNASAVNSVANQAKSSNDVVQSLCKDLSSKIDSTLSKAMERVEKSQESSNRILTETIKQMVDLSKSQHAAAMKTISEAIATDDDDDDDDDED
jgi:hypothetical protein